MFKANISATVLFVSDLEKCMKFYENFFSLGKPFTDPDSAAYRMGEHDFVLLKTSAAAEMVGEEALGKGSNRAVLLCTEVEDIDTTYHDFIAKGLSFIKPPKDQHWGRRTAYFADPEGNLWELWQNLPDAPK